MYNSKMIKPLKIGDLQTVNNIFFAPLAGLSDMTYRNLMKRHGAGLVYTEMVSAAGLARQDKKTAKYLEFRQEERPIAVQLFGSKPEEFSRSVEVLREYDFDLIDINMGCPVRKVVQSGSGSALMKDIDLAGKIIKATVAASKLPVTVKFRSGWDKETLNYLELGRICQEEGAAAVCLHPRTRSQQFSGHADWQHIKELKAELKIPVIGNGDIDSLNKAEKMFADTECDAVMIGRGAVGNPWLFEAIIKDQAIIPDKKERISMYLEHTKLFSERSDNELKAIREMRKFAVKYFKGFPGAAELRKKVNSIESYEELVSLFKT